LASKLDHFCCLLLVKLLHMALTLKKICHKALKTRSIARMRKI
jgi:hypothetical protein